MLISALRTFIKNPIKESFYEEKKKTIKFFVHLKDILRGARGHVPPLALFGSAFNNNFIT